MILKNVDKKKKKKKRVWSVMFVDKVSRKNKTD